MGSLTFFVAVVTAVMASAISPWVQRNIGWSRPNHRGTVVPSAEGIGILFVASAVLGFAKEWFGVFVVISIGVVGLLDDVLGNRTTGGFRGHLRALAAGRVTTGFLKLVAIPGCASLWAFLSLTGPWHHKLAGAVLVAGLANVVNLLDTRAGRARAFAPVFLVPIVFSAAIGVAEVPLTDLTSVFLCTAPGALRDRRGEGMLGDVGANAIGALYGWAVVRSCPEPVVFLLAIVVVGLNAIAERVSFHSFLSRTPVIRTLDRWSGVR